MSINLGSIKEVNGEYLLDKLCSLFQNICKTKDIKEKQRIYLEIDDIRCELLRRLKHGKDKREDTTT